MHIRPVRAETNKTETLNTMAAESFRTTLIKIGSLVLASAAVALLFNGARTQGIPLVEDWTAKMAARPIPSAAERLSLEQAVSYFHSGQAVFLDARDEVYYEMSHIQGAYNLPIHEFQDVYPRMADILNIDTFIITYCEGFNCQMSDELAVRLIMEGYARVGIYTGGIEEWTEQGLPVSQGKNP